MFLVQLKAIVVHPSAFFAHVKIFYSHHIVNLYRVSFVFRSTPPSRPDKVGLKCLSARPYVRPSTKRFFDLNEI